MISIRQILHQSINRESTRQLFYTQHRRPKRCCMRYMSSNNDDSEHQERHLPSLMNYSVRPSPNFLHTFKNFIFANVIVQPYYDKEFSKEDFLDGAKSAVEFVSNKIAEGEFEKLKDSKALTEDCFRDVVLNSSNFSMDQLRQIALSKEDIIFNFMYQIGVILDDDRNTRHVEITYTAHYKPEQNRDTFAGDESQDFETFQRSIVVLTYRFIRDYSKGVEDSWTINALNHVSMKDVLDGHEY